MNSASVYLSNTHIQNPNLVITVASDALAPVGARPAAGMVLTPILNLTFPGAINDFEFVFSDQTDGHVSWQQHAIRAEQITGSNVFVLSCRHHDRLRWTCWHCVHYDDGNSMLQKTIGHPVVTTGLSLNHHHPANATWRKHDDVIKWNHFPRYWPFVRGIHRSPVNSPHKGQWRGALMFSLICVWINGWVNNRGAGDLRRYRAHYDAIVMMNNFHDIQTWLTRWFIF